MQFDDQGLLNTDPRFIAIAVNNTDSSDYINNIPTDVQGLTFSRTPQMVGALLHSRLCHLHITGIGHSPAVTFGDVARAIYACTPCFTAFKQLMGHCSCPILSS